MKQKLANYIADYLVEHGITQSFSVTGGGAMHLNDALGHKEGLYTLYQHHEQACAMAAEAYARIHNRPALLCVTSGPGGTNTITGVLGAWLDSLPMLVLSGQVRYDNTARWSGVNIRAMGDQEFDITRSIACMTKYSEMLIDPYRVRYALEKALYLCQTGRPGPCWLDIPVNVQGAMIETEELVGFDAENYAAGGDGWCPYTPENVHRETAQALQNACACTPKEEKALQSAGNPHRLPEDGECQGREQPLPALQEETVTEILDRIRRASRPIFYTGNGIRIAGAEELFLQVAHLLNIPVVVGWNGPDIIPTEDPLYVGRPGGRGDRPGNLAVQNADLILSIGSRLNIRQVGYNFRTWAREAYVIVNDIDLEELKKPSVHADMRIHADARVLLGVMLKALKRELGDAGEKVLFQGGQGLPGQSWLETCGFYRAQYPTVLPEHFAESPEENANVYAVVDILSRMAEPGQVTVVGNGSPCVAGGQAYLIRQGSRFISQDGVASMGYGLPAAIGVCAAIHGPDAQRAAEPGAWRKIAERNPYWAGAEEVYPDYGKHDVILLTGDGSIQMNLQELQTIIHHHMPIKIFIINNGGYHSIRQTQNSFFGKPLVGIGVDSGVNGQCDLSFPDMEKLAAAYGYPFLRVSHNQELKEAFRKVLDTEGPVICEIMVTMDQQFLPKSAAKRLPDGSLVSPPLEDMAPFLSEEEMDRIMIVPRLK